MGFLLFDGCFHSLLSLHDIINLAFPFVSNKNKRNNKEPQKILRDLFSSCEFRRVKSTVTMSAVEEYADSQLTGVTGLACLWDQLNLAGHVYSLAGLWACGHENREEVPPALRAVLCLQNRLWAEKAVRLAGKRQ